MTRLSVAIMHLPGHREDLLARILARLGQHEDVFISVVNDPEPDGERSSWRTARVAWSWHAFIGADHALTLQDDSWPCRDFIPCVLMTTRLARGHAVSYWHNRAKITAWADAMNSPWAVCEQRGSGQALHLPGRHVAPFLRFVEHVEADPSRRDADGRPCLHPTRPWKPTGDDTRFVDYLRHTGLRVWATVPSLVEHALPADSLLGHSNASRTAHRFADDVCATPLELHWKRTP